MTSQRRERHERESEDPSFVPLSTLRDFDPFAVDPIMRRLHRRGTSASTVWLACISTVALAGTIASMRAGNFFPVRYGRSTFGDIATLFARPKSETVGETQVPLLRDYPTLLLAFTCATAAPFIYSLFGALSQLHSSLAENQCLEIARDHDVAALDADIEQLNARVERFSRPATALYVFAAIYVLVALMLVRQSHDGFFYLTAKNEHMSGELFRGWWARPFSAGFFVASVVGAIGAYLVYIEAVVGLQYVAFVRRNSAIYRFRANRYNVDRNYGWSVLARAFRYMLLGVATATLSAGALYYFLRPVLPVPLVVIVLSGFLIIVCYVSLASSILLRRHVVAARTDACTSLSHKLEALQEASTVEELLRRQVLNEELTYFREIPDFPIRGVWLFLAGVGLAIGLTASISQIIYVVTH